MYKGRVAWWGLVVLLSGCVSLQEERALQYLPAPTNPPDTRNIFVTEYTAAIAAAQSNPTKTNILRMVDSGSAVSAISCGEWVDRDILAAQGLIANDHLRAVIAGATTMAAGAFAWSPHAVATVGLLSLLSAGFDKTVKSGLGAPESFTVQSTLLATLGSCSDSLLMRAKNGDLTFSQAIIGIDRCRRFCSPGAATAISTQALTGVEVDAAPTGRMILRRTQP